MTLELNALRRQSQTSKDPYFLALVANDLINRGQLKEAIEILKKLSKSQQADGHLDAAQTSITGSGGRDLQIETTALTLLGWLKAKRPDLFNRNVQAAAKWIGQQRGGYGGFGSTQSTILALKALIAFANDNKKTPEEGDLALFLGDQLLVRQHFPAGVQEAITLDLKDTEKYLKPGKNALRVEITGKNVFPYTAAWSYHTLKPASPENCPNPTRDKARPPDGRRGRNRAPDDDCAKRQPQRTGNDRGDYWTSRRLDPSRRSKAVEGSGPVAREWDQTRKNQCL